MTRMEDLELKVTTSDVQMEPNIDIDIEEY